MANFDISNYDEAIQKAIKIFEEDLAMFKQEQENKNRALKNTITEIKEDLETLKNDILKNGK